jgi:hypothetical protein
VGVACLSLTAIYIERTVLVYPNVLQRATSPYGAIDLLVSILVTVGFGALFVLCHLLLVPRLGLTTRVDV